MNSLVLLTAIFGCAFASPQVLYNGYPLAYNYPSVASYAPVQYSAGVPLTYAAAPVAQVVPAFTKTQYHAQDELGQASFGHSQPGQAHSAVRDAAGGVRGTYAYIDPTGKEVRVNYVADHNGYRADSNALPVAPQVTLVGPAPVQDTPEVQAARAEHFRAIHEIKSRTKRGVGVVVSPAHTPANTALIPNTVALHHPVAYSTGLHHSVSYSAGLHHPVAYTNPLAYTSPLQFTHGQAFRPATLTRTVLTPGHSVAYRVDK